MDTSPPDQWWGNLVAWLSISIMHCQSEWQKFRDPWQDYTKRFVGRGHCDGAEWAHFSSHPSSQGSIITGEFLGKTWGDWHFTSWLPACWTANACELAVEQGRGVVGFLLVGYRGRYWPLPGNVTDGRMTAAHNGRVRREGSCGIGLQVSSLASLGCMNCPGTTWRLEDRAHFEKVTVAKGVRERHSTEGRLEGNMKKTQPKHPTCARESRPMARSLARQRASESQRHYRLRWPSKGPLSPSPLTLPSDLSGLQKLQKWLSELGGGGAGAGT